VRLVRKHHFEFISSLSWTDELASLYEKGKPPMKESSFLSINEQRKRRLGKPQDTWERYSVGEIPYTIAFEEKRAKEAGAASTKPIRKTQSIRARLVFVHSTADMKVCRKTRAKNTEKIKKGLEDIQRSVTNGYIKEIPALHHRVHALYGKKQARNYFTYEVEELTPSEMRSLPPRRRGQRIPALKFSYLYHPEIAEHDAHYDGLYAIATSLRKKTHSTDQVFHTFKEQHHIETAHHQWKAPLRLRPLFLKKAKRIESLVFVQFLALMAFYLLQRLYRLAKGPSCRTTAETLLKRFILCAIGLRYRKRSVHVEPFALTNPQQLILRTLRFPLVHAQIKSYVTRRKD
jgi:transposase